MSKKTNSKKGASSEHKQMVFVEKGIECSEEAIRDIKEAIRQIGVVLKNRIKERPLEDIFRKNKVLTSRHFREDPQDPEQFTKAVIIEPLLNALGYTRPYDLIDETHQKSRKADYTLKSGDKYILMEAEPLNKNLETRGSGVHQVEQWVQLRTAITDYGIATNGFEWRLLKYDENSGKLKEIERVDIKPLLAKYAGLPTLAFGDEDTLIEKFCTVFSNRTIIEYLEGKFLVLEEMQEEVTKKFYREYIELVFGVSEDGEHIRGKYLVNSIIAPVGATEKDIRLFSITLMNRLFFIKFLEEKGLVEKRMLLNLKRKYNNAETLSTFYKTYIEPLFFDVFNKPVDKRRPDLPQEFRNIPYLNGGLFREVVSNERSYDVDNEIFKEIIEFLESYRFLLDRSVRGNDTDEYDGKEGELDPDILGNIFERTINFISGSGTNEQKAKGAYYTQEPIVNHIVKNTIDPLLYERIIEVLREAGWSESDLRKYDSLQSIFDDPPRTVGDLKLILEVLEDLKVLDPACGSGHFLTGVLKELVRIYMTVHAIRMDRVNKNAKIDLYELKKKIILNNIYGGDIEEPAVEIAKLRLWLSLIEDLDMSDEDQIKELPNIEYNIRCGNSLIGFKSEQIVVNGQKKLVSEELRHKLREYREKIEKYVNENDVSIKDEIEGLHKVMQDELDEIYLESLDIMVEGEIPIDEVGDILGKSEGVDSVQLVFKEKINDDESAVEKLSSAGFRVYQKSARLQNLSSSTLEKEKVVEVVSELGDRIAKVVVRREMNKSDLDGLKSFHWVIEFSDVMLEKVGFDVIVGNPPHGNILGDIEKTIVEMLFEHSSKDNIAEVFIERAYHLLRPGGMLGYVIPKTIAFYSEWENSRTFLIQRTMLTNILDIGIGFEKANFEQLGVIFKKREPEVDNSTKIYAAEPLKSYKKKRVVYLGEVPQNLMHHHGLLIFRPISDEEKEIIAEIVANSIKFREVYAKAFRGLYIPDSEKQKLKEGEYVWIDKVPFVKRYYVTNLKRIDLKRDWLETARGTLQPRLFFKVLRGRRLVCFPDTTGSLLTTEKLVNVVLPHDSKYDLLTLAGIFNSHVPSFYIQKMLFSETTETSRVMDDRYVGEIPVPKNIPNDSIKIIVSYLLFLNSVDALRESGKEMIEFFDSLLDALVYYVYFESRLKRDGIDKDLTELMLKHLKPIDYDRFAKYIYNAKLSEEEKETLKEIIEKYLGEIRSAYSDLKKDSKVTATAERILSHEWVFTIKRVTTKT